MPPLVRPRPPGRSLDVMRTLRVHGRCPLGRSCGVQRMRSLPGGEARGAVPGAVAPVGRISSMRARSSELRAKSAAPAFSAMRWALRVPGMGTTCSPRVSSHARASCATVPPLDSARAVRCRMASTFFSKLTGCQRASVRRKSDSSYSAAGFAVPVRKPRPSGAYGTNPMPSSSRVGNSASTSRSNSEYSGSSTGADRRGRAFR